MPRVKQRLPTYMLLMIYYHLPAILYVASYTWRDAGKLSGQVHSYERVKFKQWGIKEKARQDMYDDDVRVMP